MFHPLIGGPCQIFRSHVWVILCLHGQPPVGIPMGGCRALRIAWRTLRGGGDWAGPATATPGGRSIAADRYLRVRLAPGDNIVVPTTLGCSGKLQQCTQPWGCSTATPQAWISDRPSRAETVETALESLELDFGTRLGQETLPLPAQLCGHT